MGQRIVILGGGTGGTLMANRLQRHHGDDVEVTVVDRDDRHVYQPGLLFVPFGMADADEIVRPRRRQLRKGVAFREAAVDRVEIEAQEVHLDDGSVLPYDVLVVATGARLLPEETDGLTGPGWNERVFSFYDLPGAVALRGALQRFEGGRLVVDVVDMPDQVPGRAARVLLPRRLVPPGAGHPGAGRAGLRDPARRRVHQADRLEGVEGILQEKGIELVTEFNVGEVDGVGGRLVSYDDRVVPFDLAVVVPLHGGAEYVERSPGLGDELGFVPTDPRTLQSTVRPNIFAIGDATDVPASKAGSVTHFEGEVLLENVNRFLEGRELDATYDGHANCFIETGFHKAMLIDFNYDTEPTTGHFPGAVGAPLLKDSRLNHLGKLMFQWVYWHALLPGRDIPGIGPDMPTAGKRLGPS